MPAPEDSVETPEENRSGAAGALSALGRNDHDDDPYIEEFEDALEQGRPIVIWVYTESSERSMRRDREESQRFFDEVLNTPAATAMLAQCVCIKLEGEDLDRNLARKYGLSRSRVPQFVVYDYEGDKLGSINPRSGAEAIAAALEDAIERCEAMLERED